MKILVILVISGLIFYLGYCFSAYYKKKLNIFTDLVKLSEILEGQIRFNKTTINQIIEEHLNIFSNEFKQLLTECHIKNNINFNCLYLNKEEFEVVKNFLQGLGRYDVKGEISNIKNQQIIINIKRNEIKEKDVKIGSLGTKLGFLCAVLVFIIFI